MESQQNKEENEEQLAHLQEMEAQAEIGQKISAALSTYKEIYLADDSLVFNFESLEEIEEGISLLKDHSKDFETHISIDIYAANAKDLIVEIPNNGALYIRISADRILSLAMRQFEASAGEQKAVNLVFKSNGVEPVKLSGQCSLTVYDKR
jgi:hypothetical protein